MTVGRMQLPDGPIYVPEDPDTPMQAREWTSVLSIVCDLDQVLLKEVMAENRGLTFLDLKNHPLSTLQPHLKGVNPTMTNWNLLL